MLHGLTHTHTHTHTKRHKETFQDHGYVYYLDFGDSIIGVCICLVSSNCIH